MGKVLVVGVGAGREHLTPEAAQAIASAKAFAGGREALRVAPQGMPTHEIRNIEDALRFVEEHLRSGNVAVLTSGDSTLYSILEVLRRRLGEEVLEVVPGVSWVQVCFARLKRCWNGVRVLSLHGRSLEELGELSGDVAILCDPTNTPQRVAAHLLELVGDRRCAVCDCLCSPGERVVVGWLSEVAGMRFSGRSVMVVWDEAPRDKG